MVKDIPVEERRRRARINYKRRRDRDLAAQQNKQFEATLKYKYGISVSEYNSLLESQNWTCPVTGEKLGKGSHIDHCHRTGKVRGILSRHGNQLLGQAHDSIETLQRAIRYLAEHS